MTTLRIWILAARPKTLFAVISPILIANTLAFCSQRFSLRIFIFTLLTGLGIQISTNFCNDYFDFIKGADTKDRKGPIRVTSSGLVSLKTMKKACSISLALTAFFGLFLLWHGGIVIGFLLAISLLLAVGYTAGPVPLAYKGLGDLFVFIFFGPIACLSSFYLQTKNLSLECNIIGIALGSLSTAILAVNNIRDIEEDEKARKMTLAVRFGIIFGKIEYLTLLLIPAVISMILSIERPLMLISVGYLAPAFFVTKKVLFTKSALELNSCLAKTGKLLIIYTLLLCIARIYS